MPLNVALKCCKARNTVFHALVYFCVTRDDTSSMSWQWMSQWGPDSHLQINHYFILFVCFRFKQKTKNNNKVRQHFNIFLIFFLLVSATDTVTACYCTPTTFGLILAGTGIKSILAIFFGMHKKQPQLVVVRTHQEFSSDRREMVKIIPLCPPQQILGTGLVMFLLNKNKNTKKYC